MGLEAHVVAKIRTIFLTIYYLVSGFLYGISGTLISVLMRIELFSSGAGLYFIRDYACPANTCRCLCM